MMQTKILNRSLLGTEGHSNEPIQSPNVSAMKRERSIGHSSTHMRMKSLSSKKENEWCPRLMLMRHYGVENDCIQDAARAWKLLQERFYSMETPTAVILVAYFA